MVRAALDRAGVLRAAGDLEVLDLAAPFAVPDLVLAVVRDDVDLRAALVRDLGAALVRDLGAAVFFAVADVFDAPEVFAALAVLDVPAVRDVAAFDVDLRAVDVFVPVRADAVVLERPDAAEVDLRAVVRPAPFLLAAVFRAVVARVPVDLAVVVMTLAAASIALAASDMALVALVIALVIAVIALADEEALVATDFICVAAVLAWLAALVTRVAAADDDADDRVDAAGFLAVLLLVAAVRLVVRPVVDLDGDFAAEVRLAAGFLAAVDLVADVLFVRAAVPRLAVRDAVLVGTDLPPL
ncbi:hypothetical protein [Actinomadura sp. K4S16]|uniref:hypothetical protein n=1 Tax=Actinomadura sp. K4S16 TaxID=1316147 RepID=UPI0011EEFF6C|nr:hypothetical protein [Actinomadura sp. K4S16]